jgi:tyrosyl-tRNA synthetase
LQVGGSDQWGNITAGIDLARRMRGVQLYGMTCPLLLNREGEKFGKTAQGTKVWLAAERTSPYLFYQYWINVPDCDVGRCLRYLTELSREEVASLDDSLAKEPDQRLSQQRLAQELTRLVHGEGELAIAERATKVLFGAEISGFTDAQLLDVFPDVPSNELPRSRLEGEGLGVLDALVAGGLVSSKGEARRLVQQGGAYINNRRCNDPQRRLTTTDLASKTVIVLRSGKKRYALLRPVV